MTFRIILYAITGCVSVLFVRGLTFFAVYVVPDLS